MSNVDVTRDAPNRMVAPVDDSVKIPDSVKRAAALAESYYKDAPAAIDPKDAPVADPVADPVAAADPVVDPKTAPAAPAAPAANEPVSPEQWEHRYNSMKGRYDQSQHTIGSLQEQMSELGNELIRTQALLPNAQQRQPSNQNQPQSTTKLVTDDDVKNYGTDLIDLTKRAAMEAVSPELERLNNENAELRQRETRLARQALYTALDTSVPTWREINVAPRFVEWLRTRDIYSGAVRQNLLNQAFQAANAPRVAQFFKGFLAEEAATGNANAPNPQPEPQGVNPAPRQAAVTLESLAAPGRARPATGDTQVPVDKPIYTHKQVAAFYANVRRGFYNGRPEVKDADEAMIFAAQREGRIR